MNFVKNNRMHYFIVPGLGNSGPDHWQSYFEKTGSNFHRIQQTEWDAPNCTDWITEIEKAITGYEPSTVILIGHSLGCTAIAHWAVKFNKIIKGALLVAPSDIENPIYTFPAKGFSPIPLTKINFKTIVVASSDDPWVTPERSGYFADCWGSELINIGNAGHINTSSGYGFWVEGLEILKRIV
jgi:predicted alpha/beta hydrolase family esterase